ncbi:hypothetical protein ACFFF7_04470 [Novosphingobium aquiterrae]|uniref:LPXTG cell wall anchor domain-containing protein n=1 Tax=Novosphingobium aquiterrae TaxID=624388 RepID=A0ABV6PHW8_9SPHN
MTKATLIRSPRAFAATVAALALVPVPVMAQEAVPAGQAAPAAEAAPAPAPAPVAPTILSQPVIQAVPTAIALPEEPAAVPPPAVPAKAAAPTRTARSTAAPRAAAVKLPSAAAAPTASGPVPSTLPPAGTGPDAVTPVAAAEPAALPVAESAAQPAPANDEKSAALALGGAILVIGAGAGYVLSRRRKRVGEDLPVVEYEPVSVPVEREPDVPAAVPVQPVEAPAPRAAERQFAAGADRQALIESMVAAPPDAANPFTTAKARRRRARLILQAREARQQNHSDTPFDYRTYRPEAVTIKHRTPEFV